MKLNEWNYNIDEMPKVGTAICLNFLNGKGTDSRFPYMVETIEVSKRGDYSVWTLEGRRILKNGQLRDGDWFQVYFTDKECLKSWWKEDKELV
tara:strand:+ start:517 stop:795 length:279 start_codon:yes stop_codon:yes gene_type:complete